MLKFSFFYFAGIRQGACTIVNTDVERRILSNPNYCKIYRTDDNDVYYISYTRMYKNTTPSPGENGARGVVCVFVCAFCLFRFMGFSGLDVDIVVGLMMS